jgi:hypothetical protein
LRWPRRRPRRLSVRRSCCCVVAAVTRTARAIMARSVTGARLSNPGTGSGRVRPGSLAAWNASSIDQRRPATVINAVSGTGMGAACGGRFRRQLARFHMAALSMHCSGLGSRPAGSATPTRSASHRSADPSLVRRTRSRPATGRSRTAGTGPARPAPCVLDALLDRVAANSAAPVAG